MRPSWAYLTEEQGTPRDIVPEKIKEPPLFLYDADGFIKQKHPNHEKWFLTSHNKTRWNDGLRAQYATYVRRTISAMKPHDEAIQQAEKEIRDGDVARKFGFQGAGAPEPQMSHKRERTDEGQTEEEGNSVKRFKGSSSLKKVMERFKAKF